MHWYDSKVKNIHSKTACDLVIHVSELSDTKTRTAVTRDSDADKKEKIVKQTVKLLRQWSARQSCIP